MVGAKFELITLSAAWSIVLWNFSYWYATRI